MLCYNCMHEKGGASVCPRCGVSALPDPAIHQLTPGTVIGRRYILGRVLGEGGFGITYIGFDRVLDIPVAVKEYFPHGFSHRAHTVSNTVTVSTGDYQAFYDKGKRSFLSEAKNVARFRDEPGIVNVSDFIEENNTAYIVMEYLDGIDLKRYLLSHGVMPVRRTVELLLPIIATLGKLHAAGIIHRDISPDNLMYLKNGKLKLMDFGAAREYIDNERSMSVVLKQGFAPEEQYRRGGDQGPWTDVYALCATIYYCITGRRPIESLDRIFEDNLKRPSELGIPISPSMEKVLMYGLEVRKKDRCQSMPELYDLMRDALTDTDVLPTPAVVPAPETPVTDRQIKPDGVPTDTPADFPAESPQAAPTEPLEGSGDEPTELLYENSDDKPTELLSDVPEKGPTVLYDEAADAPQEQPHPAPDNRPAAAQTDDSFAVPPTAPVNDDGSVTAPIEPCFEQTTAPAFGTPEKSGTDKTAPADDTAKTDAAQGKKDPEKRRKRRRILIAVIVCIIAAVGLAFAIPPAYNAIRESAILNAETTYTGSGHFHIDNTVKNALRLESTANYLYDTLPEWNYSFNEESLENDSSGYTKVTTGNMEYAVKDDRHVTYFIDPDAADADADAAITLDDVSVTVGETTLGELLDKGFTYKSDHDIPDADKDQEQRQYLMYNGSEYQFMLEPTGSDVEKAVIISAYPLGAGNPYHSEDSNKFTYTGFDQDADITQVVDRLGCPEKIYLGSDEDEDIIDGFGSGFATFSYRTTDPHLFYFISFECHFTKSKIYNDIDKMWLLWEQDIDETADAEAATQAETQEPTEAPAYFVIDDDNKAAIQLMDNLNLFYNTLPKWDYTFDEEMLHDSSTLDDYQETGNTEYTVNGKKDTYETYFIHDDHPTFDFDNTLMIDDASITPGKTLLKDLLEKGFTYQEENDTAEPNVDKKQNFYMNYHGSEILIRIGATGDDPGEAVVTGAYDSPSSFDYNGVKPGDTIDMVIEKLGYPTLLHFYGYHIGEHFGAVFLQYELEDEDQEFYLSFKYTKAGGVLTTHLDTLHLALKDE